MKSSLTLATLFALAFTFHVQAKPVIFKAFKAQYPKTKLNDCIICHISDDADDDGNMQRNSYGSDLEKTIKVKGNLPDFKAVEALDSDGDGFSNIDEINAGTLLGDKSSFPVTGLVTPQ